MRAGIDRDPIRISKQDDEREESYPEVDLQIATAPEFAITDLKADRHFVIFVQRFMVAFSRVSLKLDGVCSHSGDPPQRGDQEGCCGKSHGGGVVPCLQSWFSTE